MEEILINIVDNMEKRIIFVDEFHIIKYLNNSAKEHYKKKGLCNLVGRSIFEFHKPETNEKIKNAAKTLEEDNSLSKVIIGSATMYAIRVKNKFCGYYEMF